MNQHFTGKFIKRNGTLELSSLFQKKQYEHFVSSIEDGQIVEVFLEETHDDGTLPQLAKLHAMIKDLALHVGESVENMKLLIKEKAGLCIIRNVSGKEYFLAKSFGECSKEELSLAIQATINLGHELSYPVG